MSRAKGTMSSAWLGCFVSEPSEMKLSRKNYFAMKWKTSSMENNFFCAIVIGKLQIIPYRSRRTCNRAPEKAASWHRRESRFNGRSRRSSLWKLAVTNNAQKQATNERETWKGKGKKKEKLKVQLRINNNNHKAKESKKTKENNEKARETRLFA
jgi:hypothetical protein